MKINKSIVILLALLLFTFVACDKTPTPKPDPTLPHGDPAPNFYFNDEDFIIKMQQLQKDNSKILFDELYTVKKHPFRCKL